MDEVVLSHGGDSKGVRIESRDTQLKVLVQRGSQDFWRCSINWSRADVCSLPDLELVAELPEEAVHTLEAEIYQVLRVIERGSRLVFCSRPCRHTNATRRLQPAARGGIIS
jgi:hypothetical protein